MIEMASKALYNGDVVEKDVEFTPFLDTDGALIVPPDPIISNQLIFHPAPKKLTINF